MVLSGTKKTSSLSSIVNQNQGGGNKKAGLPEQVGRTSWESIHMRKTSQRMAVLTMPLTTTTRISRPVGIRPGAY
jgi:hypothetical protein